MSDGSTIEWLNWPGYKPATWNPTRGCTRISSGCTRCYAERMAARFSRPGQWGHGIAEMRGGDHRWTGVVEFDEAKLTLPLKWRSPRCVFVNSTSDMFHERLPDEAIDRVFAVMALCPQHRFIVLTKRAERMREYMAIVHDEPHQTTVGRFARAIEILPAKPRWRLPASFQIPLPNVVLGVSVEDQATADERIPHLPATPAACRMVSAEPLLGPIDISPWLVEGWRGALSSYRDKDDGIRRADIDGRPTEGIDWVVAGSESGHGARDCDLPWVRGIRDQCVSTGVAFFWKQHVIAGRKIKTPELDGQKWINFPNVG